MILDDLKPIYFPNDLQGAITINVEADQENFDEFVLVVVQNINQGTVAKQIGTYSTKTSVIELDQIKDETNLLRFLYQTKVTHPSHQN